MLTAYIDESRSGDKRIFALGGWLCCEEDGTSIENEWRQRVELESRLSRKKGFPPVSRYKAADLSNLQGEYSRLKGWDEERQKRFIKKLIEILTRKRQEPVVGFSMSAIMDNWQIAYKTLEWAEKNVYRHLFMQCARLIGEAINNRWSGSTASIFHDHGPFNATAQAAFRAIRANNDFPERDSIATVDPRRWQDCTLLQPADMLAYEGQKAAALALKVVDDVELQTRYRKSLQKLLSGKLTMRGLCFTRFFENVMEWRRAGNGYPAKTATMPPSL